MTVRGRIYSVGHSNNSLEDLVGLLHGAGVSMIVDVRSQPVSRWSPQFNRKSLQLHLPQSRVEYIFAGDRLGGRPTDPEAYNPEGFVVYSRIATSGTFADGLDWLIVLAQSAVPALMCAEEDPLSCHRFLLIGRALGRRGIDLVHIRKAGSLERQSDIEARAGGEQRDLFAEGETPVWRSAWPARRPPRK